MGEFDPILPQSEKTEINAVVPAKKQRVLDRLFPLPGHRIFEFNLDTKIINEVIPEKKEVFLVPEIDIRTGKVTGTTGQKHGVIKQKENCRYVTALNAVNADKAFHKMFKIKYTKKKK